MSGVLVVCTANVCRSPLAASILATSGVFGSAEVNSAGVHAAPAGSCDVAAAVAARAGAPLDLPRVPHQLTADDIAKADLILTAEVAHISAVPQLVPGARARTFTILQALHLARLLDWSTRPQADDVPAFASALARGRGLAVMPSRSRWRGRRGWDLLDGHGRPFAVHRLRVGTAARADAELSRATSPERGSTGRPADGTR